MKDQILQPKDQLTHTMEGARMILPGIQALFGFQLIAVFQPTFAKELGAHEQRVHLAAICLAALATALVIAPASVHRMASPDRATLRLVKISSQLLTWGMLPLAVAVFLDFGLLARLILHNAWVAWGLALVLLGVYLGLWIVLPRWFRHYRGI